MEKGRCRGRSWALRQCMSVLRDCERAAREMIVNEPKGNTHVSREQDVHLPPPVLSVKLCVKALKNDNGATRLVPCQRNSDKVPTPEPGTWRRSQLCPLPMGTAIVRASSPVPSLLQQRSTPRTGADTFYNQDVYSGSGIRAAAGIEEGHPRRAGPDAEAPRSGPGSGPFPGRALPLRSGARCWPRRQR